MMDQATYQRWWPLHLRSARGETLSAQEQEFYEAGLRQLEQGELPAQEAASLQEARAAVTALEAEHEALVARRQQLDHEIAALEAALPQQTQQPLGAKE